MIIPSIDLQNGSAVQLEQGRELKIDAGDPLPLFRRFQVVGETAVIDLDAALGRGSNRDLVLELLRQGKCRVGGGIRDLETARLYLNAGAQKIIIGSRAEPEFLRELPRERVVVALDCRDGEVVTKGWTEKTGKSVEERIAELKDFADEFMVTFVEVEGTLQGLPLERAAKLKALLGNQRLTVAGGISSVEEIRALDEQGIDAQVGMALYSGKFSLADALSALMREPDALWPTIVREVSGSVLGLCWSKRESLATALAEKRGVYWSRTRGLWRKGETSGNSQELIAVELDCDRDALCFTVQQSGSGFCHTGDATCFGADDFSLGKLERIIEGRRKTAKPGSYTAQLFADPNLLSEKILEEAAELVEAKTKAEVRWEAADVFYFALAKMVDSGVRLADVVRELELRNLKVSR